MRALLLFALGWTVLTPARLRVLRSGRSTLSLP